MSEIKVTSYRPRSEPDYDPSALEAAIKRFDDNIAIFQKEIQKLMEQKMEYMQLLATARAKKSIK